SVGVCGVRALLFVSLTFSGKENWLRVVLSVDSQLAFVAIVFTCLLVCLHFLFQMTCNFIQT
uniref:Uncharacterized protein n=1 Tax=Triticum urartu TaxID=4572 RepID=A0A8R7TJF4_TRIUA